MESPFVIPFLFRGDIMKYLYHISFKIKEKERNHEKWINTINELLNIDLSLKKLNSIKFRSEPRSITEEWYYYMRDLLKGKSSKLKLEGSTYSISRIAPKHNRYQKCCYLMIYFEDVENDKNIDDLHAEEFINDFREHTTKILGETFEDKFEYKYKETPLVIKGNTDEFRYNESIYLVNPVRLYEKAKSEKAYKISPYGESRVSIKDNVRPEKSGLDSCDYARAILLNYYMDEDEYKIIETHFTSMFILFHRTNEYLKEFNTLDREIEFVYNISTQLNNRWERGRSYLMTLNGIFSKNKFDKAYYSIMELNTMIDGIITKLIADTEDIKEKYNMQYERVLANFDTNDKKLISEVNKVRDLQLTPIRYRESIINDIMNLKEPTNLQVERLRNLFDAKSSTFMERKMFVITIFVTIWGIYTFWYSSVFASGNAEDLITLINGTFPRMLTTSTTLAIIGTMVLLNLNRVLNLFTKKTKTVKEINRYVKKLKKNGNNISKRPIEDALVNDTEMYSNMDDVRNEEKLWLFCKLIVNILVYKIYSKEITNKEFDYDRFNEMVNNIN